MRLMRTVVLPLPAPASSSRALCGQDALELHGVEILKARGDDRAAGGQKSGFKCLFHSFTFK